MAVGQVQSSVIEAQQWFSRVTAADVQPSMYDRMLIDAFARDGVTRASQITEASLAKTAGSIGVSTEGLLAAMKGRCPFGGGLQAAQAKQAE